jgi:molybdate transport system substrate-binding protein
MTASIRLVRFAGWVACTIALVNPGAASPPGTAGPLAVSVASSLADVMAEIGRAFQAEGGPGVTLNVAGSNFLARQIVAGARVDVFISADGAQMDLVERAGRLVDGSRRDLLTNRLVVVVPASDATPVEFAADLAAPRFRRVAMGNPDSVPAGVYGRQWLERQAVWSLVAPRVVPTLTVRSALAAVGAGRADAGIVFATEARTTANVRVAYVVPDQAGPAIRYPAAVVRGSRAAESARLVAFLSGVRARAIFERAGFGVIAR